MGSWWSSGENDSVEILLIGCKDAGKSHFIERFERTHCPVRPTYGFKSFTLTYKKTDFRFKEIGSTVIGLEKIFLYHLQKERDCVYAFIDAKKSLENLFESKQFLLLCLLKMKKRIPIFIILNERPDDQSSCTLKEVERVFQLRSLCKKYPITMIRLSRETNEPLQYLLNWTMTLSSPAVLRDDAL